MGEEYTQDEINKALFINLVMMFGSAAMHQMGKMVNPATGKAEIDLDGAQASIDMLNMLGAKTKGNLVADEERLLMQTLSSLQMNYVETAQSAEAVDKGKQPSGGTPGPKEQAAVDQTKTGEKKEPKYHKSYSEKG